MITEKVKARHGEFNIIKHDQFISKCLKDYGEWGEGEMPVYKSFLNQQSIVVEVGAHLGSLTVPISKLCHSVYAFEPQRTVFQILNSNLVLNQIENVFTYMNPVGNQNKLMYMNEVDYHHPKTQSGFNSGGVHLKDIVVEQGGYPASMIRLDDFLPDHLKVAFIKVDAETMELDVMRGATQLIHRCQPVLYLESSINSDLKLEHYVRDLGYKVYQHTPPGWSKDNYNKNPMNHLRPNNGIYDYMILCVPKRIDFKTDLKQIC